MKRCLLIFLSLIFIVPAIGQIKVECEYIEKHIYGNYLIIGKGGTYNYVYGVIDREGNTVIDIKYKNYSLRDHSLISDDIFYGKDANTSKYILINLENKKTIKESENFTYSGFFDGMALIREYDDRERKTLLYYIDREGKTICHLPENASKDDDNFYKHSLFNEGLARVYFGVPTNYFSEKFLGYGYIDKTGKTVIEPRFSGANPFFEGLACINIQKDGQSLWGFINKSGEVVIDCMFSNEPSSFSDGLAQVKSKDGKFGFINKKGEVVIQPLYKYATGFYKGKAIVTKGYSEPWKIIDKEGNDVKVFDDVSEFKYISSYRDKSSQKVSAMRKLIDEGVVIVTLDSDRQKKEYAIDITGSKIFKKKFREIGQFKNGIAYARYENDETYESTYGIIDKTGKFIIIVSESQF